MTMNKKIGIGFKVVHFLWVHIVFNRTKYGMERKKTRKSYNSFLKGIF